MYKFKKEVFLNLSVPRTALSSCEKSVSTHCNRLLNKHSFETGFFYKDKYYRITIEVSYKIHATSK